jgi:hypothetical protein
MAGTVRKQLSNGLRAVTEPVLGRVRRVLAPIRLGPVAPDTGSLAARIPSSTVTADLRRDSVMTAIER